jgi:hypothetical protein
MAITKIQSESLNLADDYTFTGTIAGAGESNVPLFFAKTSGTTSVSSGTVTLIDFDTATVDTNSGFDTTNHKYTIPSGHAGKYIFHFIAKMRSATLHKVRESDIQLFKNGSSICSNNSTYNANLALQYSTDGFFMVDASVGDYFQVYAKMTIDSGTGNVNNGFFIGYKVTT